MTGSLRNLIDEASSHVKPAAPDLSEARDRIHELLVAAGKPGISDHKLASIKYRSSVVEVRTEWGSRGFVHDEEVEIPLSVIDAADPVAEARLWGIRERLAAASARAREHARELAEAEDELHAARIELYEETGVVDGPEPAKDAPDWKGLVETLVRIRDAAQTNSEGGTVDDRKAWNDMADIASSSIRQAVSLSGPDPLEGATLRPVAVVGKDWQLLWASAAPLSTIVDEQALKVGDRLFTDRSLRQVMTAVRDAASGRPSVGDAKTKDALQGVALVQSSMLAKVMRLCGEYLRTMR